MARPATGTAFTSRGVHFAVVALGGGKRLARAVPSATTLDAARERARFATELCSALTKAGHLDLHEKIVALVVEADDAARLDAIAAKVAGLCGGELVRAAPPGPAPTTFRDVREQLTAGKLHKRYPDVVEAMSAEHAKDIARKAERYVEPIMGAKPVASVTLDDALEVMRRLPDTLSAASRRHVAWGMRRVLGLAVFPLRLLAANPIPDGFMPKLGRPRARGFLYPDEVDRLGACDRVPLARRVLWSFLAREGMRKDEATGLEWSDTRKAGAVGWVDLDRGTVHLDEHKTASTAGSRDWPLDPGVVVALTRWRALQGKGRRFVFGDGTTPIQTDHLADVLREDLLAAGVDRAELHATTDTRRAMNVHDLRGVFVTTSMAAGRTEA
ncbi:MAG: hypothetical protein IPJ34_22520 [Myxococcales bacterium]|nr:hypothetical protein [Myxococcales bacterium]